MREFTPSGFPHAKAFNPALIQWRGRTLMMYRRAGLRGLRESELFIGEVGGDFQPAGGFRKVGMPPGYTSYEDARFFVFKNELHFSFVALDKFRQRTGIGVITDDLEARDCRVLEHPGGQPSEKNWIFFGHGDDLYCTYSMSAGIHQVCRVAGAVCEPCYETAYGGQWTWGHPRGGTQLIAHEGLWHGFFHASVYQGEGFWKRYYMGAYAVLPEPPFPIVRMSRRPLYTPPQAENCGVVNHSKGELMAVVFPSGLMFKDGNWLVAAGHNDNSMRGFEISHAELESNIVSTILPGAPAGPPAAGGQDKIWNVHFPMQDCYWMRVLEVARECINTGEAVVAHSAFLPCFPNARPYESVNGESLRGTRWIILHKDFAEIIGSRNMRLIKDGFDAVFANEVFVLLAAKELSVAKTHFDPIHAIALWEQMDWIEDDPVSSNAGEAAPRGHPVGAIDPHSAPLFTVAILTHNALEHTQRCLASLAKFATLPYQVFILDNLSTDGTREWLARQTAPNLHYIPSPENLGVPAGTNRLIEQMLPSSPENGFVVFADNDIEMTGPWQEPFLEFFEKHPEVGIAGKSGYRIIVHEDSRELIPPQGLRPLPVDILTGFAQWVRVAVLKQVGGIDEKPGLFCHSDDDLCVSALAAGWEVFGVPKAPVVHHGHKSGAANSVWHNDLSSKNQRYLADKWRNMGVVDGRGRIIHSRCAWFPFLNHFPNDDRYWTQLLEAARRLIGPEDTVFALECFREYFPQASTYLMFDEQGIPKVDWIIFHKDRARDISPEMMQSIRRDCRPVFANEVFVLFANGAASSRADGADRPAPVFPFEPVHVEALWAMCS